MMNQENKFDMFILNTLTPPGRNLNRPNIDDRIDESHYKLTNSFLIGSIFFQFIGFFFIVITFIFPIWSSIYFSNPSLTSATSIVLTSTQPSLNNTIVFNLGIWELKCNQIVTLTNQLTQITSVSSNNMLWQNAGYSSSNQSFVFYFLSFIQLSSTHIFVIQVLEVLHLIFAFFSFLSTSLILCLCSNNHISPCWYSICFLLGVVSFCTGLAVVIMFGVWQNSLLPQLVNNTKSSKSLDWCFYLAIAVVCSLFVAMVLILVFIVVDSMVLYKQSKKVLRISQTMNNRDVIRYIPIDYSKMPKLQKNLLTQQANNNGSGSVVPLNLVNSFSQLPPNSENPTYMLSLGNRYYYKRNMQYMASSLDDLDENYFKYSTNENNERMNE